LISRPRLSDVLRIGTREAVLPLLSDAVVLFDAGIRVVGADSVAIALLELVGQPGSVEIVQLGSKAAVAFRSVAGSDADWVILETDVTDDRPATAIRVHRLIAPTALPGIAEGYDLPKRMVPEGTRDLAEGITISAFSSAKLVTKGWGSERWLHRTDLPFGFKVIRILAGSRTSLQYHQKKAEVYFVLEGIARLHYRTAAGVVDTAPFVAGTVATVDPLAWHRVEAVSDIVLVEASTYDDGTDNIRIEDDYGRPNGHVATEHGDLDA